MIDTTLIRIGLLTSGVLLHFCWVLPSLAQPARETAIRFNDVPMDRVLRLLRDQNPDCQVHFQSAGQLPNTQPSGNALTFVTYGVEGCGGGNSYWAEAAAFSANEKGEIVRTHVFDQLGVAGIQAIDYGKKNIIISAIGWGDGDVHSCPSYGKVIRFVNDGNRVLIDVVKNFRERECNG